MNLRATLPEDGERDIHVGSPLMDEDHPDNSSDSDIDNPPAEDGGLIGACFDLMFRCMT